MFYTDTVSQRRLPLVVAVLSLVAALRSPAVAAGVVGTGTPDSCTEAALDAALAGGGSVTFNCGANPVTIPITNVKVLEPAIPGASLNVSVDGGGLIMLRGADATPLFLVNEAVTLAVANLTISNAGDGGTGSAIMNYGTVTVSKCTFVNHKASALANRGTLTVTDSAFTANSGNSGGAIANGGSLTVANSSFSNNTSATWGGAIYDEFSFGVANGGTMTVTDCTFSGNTSDGSGGAIATSAGNLTVRNSTFSGNSTKGLAFGGGAISGAGTLTVSNTIFASNSSGWFGGAVVNNGWLTVTDSTFTRNSALSGGAIYLRPGSAVVMSSRFAENTSAFAGGAIAGMGPLTVSGSSFANNSANTANSDTDIGGAISGTGTVTVANSAFSGNTGGAIEHTVGTLTVSNTTFFNNSRSTSGGAITANAGLDVSNCTLSGNGAASGGAIAVCPTQPCRGYSDILRNTIVANSPSGGNCCTSCYGTLTDGGHNLDSDGTCGLGPATDPLLDPAGLANNGGQTETIALLAGSPAINAGDESTCIAAPVNNVDQRGYVRPGTGAVNCSIGAYEYNSPGAITCCQCFAFCVAPIDGTCDGCAPVPGASCGGDGLCVTPTPTVCIGDCDTDRQVTVDNVLTMVNIAVREADVSSCQAGDANHDGQITVDEILTAVNNALNGCPK